MSLPQYPLNASIDRLNFEFYSHGPNGKVKKVISYSKIEGLEVYNLGFGDLDQTTGEIDDFSVTNNRDRDKVLGTIAISALYFYDKYPNARIIFAGSTQSRTRLYLIQITKHWTFLNNVVSAQGLINNKWESFQRNRRYNAKLIEKRKL